MKEIKTLFAFAFGNECNFGETICIVETDAFMNFNKDCVGYGFAIRNNLDANLKDISRVEIILFSDYILNGIIQFKTINSGKEAETKQKFEISLEQNRLSFNIPKLSSELNEIVLFFPKKLNYVSRDFIPFIRFEKLAIS